MKQTVSKGILLILAMGAYTTSWAQAGSGGNGFGSVLTYSLIAIAVLIFFFLIIQVSNNLLAIEAKQLGIDEDSGEVGTGNDGFLGRLFKPKKPAFLDEDTPVTYLRRGHDIALEGEAELKLDESVQAMTFAVQPTNFLGISPIPKMVVEEGAEVKAGDHLFFDKNRPEMKWVAPVSGEVIAIERGAKRAITAVTILADKEQQYRELSAFDLDNSNRDQLVEYLLDAGAWTLFRQRPFNVVADYNEVPRDIYISTFDTAPLAPNLDFIVEGQEAAFQKGLDVLAKLTSGSVYLGLNAGGDTAPAKAFTEARGVKQRWFHGKHPAGNVGVQIHHTKPISLSAKVWTLGVQEVLTLGKIFTEQRYNAERVVALTGAELKKPLYVKTKVGAKIEDLLKDNLANDHVRFISGDVLSGKRKELNGFLDFYDDQITVVEEGDDYALFGWLLPSFNTPSISTTFPSALVPDMKFKAETNTHGERRAFVVTGNYESVLPMDLYPQELMKSILIGDFEKMEGLGLPELVEEDVALCEFVCVSKQPVQQILRQGLDTMREQA
ncbi:Na(+)-translocating NADH-quinone reductase subunit A [Phaeodactylibacter xiamenensis]|jgi:Na+-transporting NADH:ubiquinone oxidoreductase subunit A|uniref:Na(+)-translocating NADH-quinone reductase subunit A n=1 Tax=Phaeodactylibacter xiamenensis TaxID=1524460 RepID=A0A098SEJ4_9BACT|nr:Na(+)-translocating NADH-quinone reductase subunit A [Phaeodactylibacter xiamenensis]KGE89367.1 Na(+)-translocating NADH-quinone reductase subunit A [Phaeodactylibacter xiamenensis]MCR9054089.1 Na(+)-translocating NADH-quinone reductase subunit A [bacterium]